MQPLVLSQGDLDTIMSKLPRRLRLKANDTRKRGSRTIPTREPLQDIPKDIPRAIHDYMVITGHSTRVAFDQ